MKRDEEREVEREGGRRRQETTHKKTHTKANTNTDTHTHTDDSIYLTDLQFLSDAGVLVQQQQSLNKEMHSKRQSSPSRIKNKERERQSKRNK